MTLADDVRAFSPPSSAAENMTCQLLIAGGGLSGLSAAEAAMQQGLDVIVIEKSVFGQQAASGLNAGQFLTGWAKPVPTMLTELAQQERERGLRGEQAQVQAQRRVRAFLRRTVEGCQRLLALDDAYNLRASVHRGVAIAAAGDADMASLKASYDFMKNSNFSAMMPPAQTSRRPFYQALDAGQFTERCGTADGLYAGGIIDFFGGSFRPRKLLHGLARSLHKRGVRFFQNTEAQALDFFDDHMTIFCGSGAAIRANALFMANAYARHINGDIHERTIFTYNYVVEWNCGTDPTCSPPKRSCPIRAIPAFTHAVTAEACTWGTRRRLKLHLRSRMVLRAEPWKRDKRCFPPCARLPSMISRTPGPARSITRSMTTPLWSAGTAGV